jgi:translation initiation factor 4E
MTPALPEDETADAACEAETDLGLSAEVAFKHPLQNSWTLWYYRNDRTRTWEENLREVRVK